MPVIATGKIDCSRPGERLDIPCQGSHKVTIQADYAGDAAMTAVLEVMKSNNATTFYSFSSPATTITAATLTDTLTTQGIGNLALKVTTTQAISIDVTAFGDPGD